MFGEFDRAFKNEREMKRPLSCYTALVEKELRGTGMIRYKVDKEKKEPAYLQLYTQLREDITSGMYRYGDGLPSKRQLAEDTGTSVITVEHAYALLIDEGYLESRERSGYYVIYREGDAFPVADQSGRFEPDKKIGISKGANKESPPPSSEESSDAKKYSPRFPEARECFSFSAYAKIMRRVLSQYGERILVKSPSFGVPELRTAISSYLARSRGIRVLPEQIVIGSGSEYLYSLLVQMLGRDKLYGIEDPSYKRIRLVYEANGASVDPLKMGNNGILSSELRRTRADVLHITPFHSYPTGITADASKRAEYIRWAEDRNALIIEDDVDSEFTMSAKAEDTVFSLEPDHTVIYLNTFSRTISASMRMSYMVLPAALSEELKAKIAFYSCSVPVYDQYVVAEFITSGDFERHINRVRRLLRRKRTILKTSSCSATASRT